MNLKRKIKMLLPYGYMKNRNERYRFNRASYIEPCIYNQYGEVKRTFYLKDNVCRHSPYTFSSINLGQTNTINWDRFNKALPIHFYSHNEILGETYECNKKFGIIVESEAIIPQLYEDCLNAQNLMKQYDAIFTHSERLLKKYENAYFIPGSSVWFGGTTGGGQLRADAFQKKTKMISLVSSDKAQCELHRFRRLLAEWFYETEGVDVMGTYGGGDYIFISDSLSDYRYSIVVENNITSCYFTEKILNCFASMTIPIYIGATEIGKFFNEKGIICISPHMNKKDIEDVIRDCTIKEYELRLDAIKDNFQRVQKYFCIEDYIYLNYKSLFTLQETNG